MINPLAFRNLGKQYLLEAQSRRQLEEELAEKKAENLHFQQQAYRDLNNLYLALERGDVKMTLHPQSFIHPRRASLQPWGSDARLLDGRVSEIEGI